MIYSVLFITLFAYILYKSDKEAKEEAIEMFGGYKKEEMRKIKLAKQKEEEKRRHNRRLAISRFVDGVNKILNSLSKKA